jgi:hypothetical protein
LPASNIGKPVTRGSIAGQYPYLVRIIVQLSHLSFLSVKRDRAQSDSPPVDRRYQVLFDHFFIVFEVYTFLTTSAKNLLPIAMKVMKTVMSDQASCLIDPIALLQAWTQMKSLD